MGSKAVVLIDKWPRWTRWFFLGCGAFVVFIALVLLSEGVWERGGGVLLAGLLVASLFRLESLVVWEGDRGDIVIRSRWVGRRSERRIRRADVVGIYLRSLGKGWELGLQLTEGAEVALCQPMGNDDDRRALAGDIAGRLGVAVVVLPKRSGPVTGGQLVALNAIATGVAFGLAILAWTIAGQPADDGLKHPGLAAGVGGLALLLAALAWIYTFKAIRRRPRGTSGSGAGIPEHS